jgi:hypothetical protein
MKIQVEWDDPNWRSVMSMLPSSAWEVIEDDFTWGKISVNDPMWIKAIKLTNPQWIIDSE